MTRRQSRTSRPTGTFRPAVSVLEPRNLLTISGPVAGAISRTERILENAIRALDRAFAGVADVSTYHNNTFRTGTSVGAPALTKAAVSSGNFGKIGSEAVDGQVYAQPLYQGQMRMSDGRIHNVLYVATEHDSLYALDASNPKAGPNHDGILWHVSFLDASRGITTVSSDDVGVQDISPEIGITGTPVVDRSTGAIYVVAATKTQATGSATSPTFTQTLYALNLASGRQISSSVIGSTTNAADGRYVNQTPVSVPGTGAGSVNGVVSFNALRENQRAGLVLDTQVAGHRAGLVLVPYASHGDIDPYHGWLIAYDARTLKLVSVYNTTPNGNFGAIWESGGAPSVDRNGDILFPTGNGTFSAYTTTTAPGASALGESGTGLGYAGIAQSAAIKFDAVDPTDAKSGTGLYYNGVFPVTDPTTPNSRVDLAGTGIDFNAAATDPNGAHTFQATLSYDGSTLTENLVDTKTGATFTHTYSGVNLASTVGGNTAYVGFGGGTDGRHGFMNVTSWTYASGGTTLINQASGFASNGGVTINGDAKLSGSTAQLTTGGGEQAGTLFANTPVNVSSFTTRFTFQMLPGKDDSGATSPGPIGDGLTFILQSATGHAAGPDFGQSVLRLRPTPGTMTLVDSFTASNYQDLNLSDKDLGATAAMLLDFPGTAHPHVALAAGKGGVIYLLDRSNLGGYTPGGPDRVLQKIDLGKEIYSNPTYVNGTVYYQANDDVMRAFRFTIDPTTNTVRLVPASTSPDTIGFPGPSVSSSIARDSGAIVWALQVDNTDSNGPATLRAYDASNLSNELYSSDKTASDAAGGSVKFVTPTIANNRVYAGLSNEVDIYGLKSSTPPVQIRRRKSV